MGTAIVTEVPYYMLSGTDLSLVQSSDSSMLDARLGAILKGILKPGETIYVVGYAPQLYFYTRIRPAVGVLSTDVLNDFPDHGAFAREAVAKLNALPPEIILDCTTASSPPNPEVESWIAARYRLVPALHWDVYTVKVRNGGRIDRILRHSKRPYLELYRPMHNTLS